MNLDENISGSEHFKWREALWLPQWNREANEQDGLNSDILENIKVVAGWMDKIRKHFGKPVKVHCWLRPEKYNQLVKGGKTSQHLLGKAVDFHVSGMSCDDVRKSILDNGLLESLGLRMEDLPGSDWVHLDDRAPGPSGRFFKP